MSQFQLYVELMVCHIGINAVSTGCSQQTLSFDSKADADRAYDNLTVQPTDSKIRRHVFKLY